MKDENKFLWAYAEKANTKKPMEELIQKGWQYGDIPVASNINWIFKEISNTFINLTKKTKDLTTQIIEQKNIIAEQQKEIINLKNKQSLLEKDIKVTDKKIDRQFDYSVGISRQICEGLTDLTSVLKTIHPHLPEIKWPLGK